MDEKEEICYTLTQSEMDDMANYSNGLIHAAYVQGQQDGTGTCFVIGAISALLAGLALFKLSNKKKKEAQKENEEMTKQVDEEIENLKKKRKKKIIK